MKRVSAKRLMFAIPISITLYGAVVGHAWADAATGWVAAFLIGYAAWYWAEAAFRITDTPWRTSADAAKVVASTAALYAFFATSSGGGYEDEFFTDMITRFLIASLVMGGPAAVAAYQHRKRFPDPDAGAER